MIEYLRLRNVGVIENAEFEIGPGLTVLTGETGAGKTMVLTAVNLLLGAKLAQGLATGKDTAVQGEWRVAEGTAFQDQLTEFGVEVVDGELLLTRTLPKEGRSRITANGMAIPQSILAEWAQDMVAVHGQSEQILLRRTSRQRDVLDRFAGAKHDKLKRSYRSKFDELTELNELYRAANESRDAIEREIATLTEGLALIDKVQPVAGEDTELAEKASRLTNLSVLQSAAAGASGFLEGTEDSDESALTRLHAARRSLESATGLDERLAEIAEQLSGASILVNEAAGDLTRYLADLDAAPEQLESIQSRRAELATLQRQFGPEIEDVLAWGQSARDRLTELAAANDLEQLATTRETVRRELGALAIELSNSREAAGKKFVKQVTEELRGLAMPTSALEVAIRTHPKSAETDSIPVGGDEYVAYGASGIDEVEFLLRAHKGADAAPISKAASGGELSRIMLALEVVLSDAATAPTMIFDEVDAGVGGKAAVEIGRRLQQLGRKTQVIVVTHLPQVAAFADQHLNVTKSVTGTVTTSDVSVLTGADRERELARMLAGQEDSEHAVAHAQELLDLAAEQR